MPTMILLAMSVSSFPAAFFAICVYLDLISAFQFFGYDLSAFAMWSVNWTVFSTHRTIGYSFIFVHNKGLSIFYLYKRYTNAAAGCFDPATA